MDAAEKDSPAPNPTPWYLRVNVVVTCVLLAMFAAIAGIYLRTASVTTLPDKSQEITLTEAVKAIGGGDAVAARINDGTDTLWITLEGEGVRRAALPAEYVPVVTEHLVDADVPLVVERGAYQDLGAPPNATVTGGVAVVEEETPSLRVVKERSPAAQYAGTGLLGLSGLLVAAATVVGVRRRRARKAEEAAAAAAAEEASRSHVPDTRFSDVAGADEALADLQEIVELLKDPERFASLGAKVPKGALLCGPPGTGKTLLARAVAGEAGVSFHAVAGSDFVEKYVGVGAKRVRDLFAKARADGKAIIFIDEIDAVARKRSSDGGGNHAESESTLIALLAEMDGFAKSDIVVLAATNRPDMLDPALTRPGRLDRRVEVPLPDRRGRERILGVHVEGKPTRDVDLLAVARRTPGFSGAQLAALVNEAALEASRRSRTTIDQECFDFAVATVAMGRARESALVTEFDRTVTAWHESGHTLGAYLIPEADDPVQVTIVPRGPAGGVTWMSGSDDIFLSRRKALAQLVVALCGRVGEEILLKGEYTQGASGDLQSATDLATRMATQYGMTRLGYRVQDPSSSAAAEVVEELLTEAHEKATALLTEHEGLLRAVAEALLDEETLTLARVQELARGHEPVRGASPVAAPWTAEKPRTPKVPTQRGTVQVGIPAPKEREGVLVGVARILESRINRRRGGTEAGEASS